MEKHLMIVKDCFEAVDAVSFIRRAKGVSYSVLLPGCFDAGLHLGHLHLIHSADKTYCTTEGVDGAKYKVGCLVIATNSDRSIRELKGKTRPVMSLRDRMLFLDSIKGVDIVTSYDTEKEFDAFLKNLRPAALVKGSEYRAKKVRGASELKNWGGELLLVPMLPGYSTTEKLSR